MRAALIWIKVLLTLAAFVAALFVYAVWQNRQAREAAIKGFAAFGRGDYDLAVATCTEAIERNPGIARRRLRLPR